jgi:hypothetical protein
VVPVNDARALPHRVTSHACAHASSASLDALEVARTIPDSDGVFVFVCGEGRGVGD